MTPLETLKAIITARDHHAEWGVYPRGTVGPDQCFDDWAADLCDLSLKQSVILSANQTGKTLRNQWKAGELNPLVEAPPECEWCGELETHRSGCPDGSDPLTEAERLGERQ